MHGDFAIHQNITLLTHWIQFPNPARCNNRADLHPPSTLPYLYAFVKEWNTCIQFSHYNCHVDNLNFIIYYFIIYLSDVKSQQQERFISALRYVILFTNKTLKICKPDNLKQEKVKLEKLGVVNRACLADTECTGNCVYKHVSLREEHREKVENQSSWSSKWLWATLQSSPIKKCPGRNLTLPYVARGSRARLLAGVHWTRWSSTVAGSPKGLSV